MMGPELRSPSLCLAAGSRLLPNVALETCGLLSTMNNPVVPHTHRVLAVVGFMTRPPGGVRGSSGVVPSLEALSAPWSQTVLFSQPCL